MVHKSTKDKDIHVAQDIPEEHDENTYTQSFNETGNGRVMKAE